VGRRTPISRLRDARRSATTRDLLATIPPISANNVWIFAIATPSNFKRIASTPVTTFASVRPTRFATPISRHVGRRRRTVSVPTICRRYNTPPEPESEPARPRPARPRPVARQGAPPRGAPAVGAAARRAPPRGRPRLAAEAAARRARQEPAGPARRPAARVRAPPAERAAHRAPRRAQAPADRARLTRGAKAARQDSPRSTGGACARRGSSPFFRSGYVRQCPGEP